MVIASWVCGFYWKRFLLQVTDPLLLETEVCVSDAALKRQIAALYVVVVLDIFTDVLRE